MSVPESFKKKIREQWDDRSWKEPSTTDDNPDKLFDESNEVMEKVFGQSLSREQFDEQLFSSESKALDVVTRLSNQRSHLNNSLLHHPANDSAVTVTAHDALAKPMIKDLAVKTAMGQKQSALLGFDLIHSVYSVAHDSVKDDENFQNSYAGMHLKDMVETTIPTLRKEFEGHLNNME